MYCTNTIFKDGSKNEDKGLYLEGLVHALECCKNRAKGNPEIRSITLLGGPNDNHLVYWKDGQIVHKALGKFFN